MSETAARQVTVADPPIDGASATQPQSGAWTAPGHVSRVKPGGLARQAVYVLIDLGMVCLSATCAFWMKFGLPYLVDGISQTTFWPLQLSRIPGYGAFLILYAALIVLACIGQDLYRTQRGMTSSQESIAVAKAVGLSTAVLVLFIFTSGNKEISRLVVMFSGVGNVLLLSGWRYAKREYVSRRLQRGIGTQRTLIVGANKLGHDLAACFEQNHELGYVFCGFLDPHPNGDKRVLGHVDDLRQAALAQFVDAVFVTLPTDREVVKRLAVEARSMRLNLFVVPDLYDGLALHAPIRTIAGFPTLKIHGQPIPVTGLAVKRFFDVIVSLIGIIVSAPLMAAAALWIACDSRGPIFYSALRVGRKGRKFTCHKLRTMFTNAAADKAKLRESNNERHGPFFKMQNDPRITRSGYFLRKYSIDELPQLFNVLWGDMSLVGPRPHPVDDVERYCYEDMRRLEVKPGLTGLWQITARTDPSFKKNMELDLEYIENWSLRLDLKILARTIPEVLRASGR